MGFREKNKINLTNSSTNIIIIIESCQNFIYRGFAISGLGMREPHRAILLILCAIAAFAVCVSCGDPPPFSGRGDPDTPDVRWTEDWKYVTVFLDGAHLLPKYNPNAKSVADGTQGGARALSPDAARMSFSFFEVFFYCDGEIKRVSWEIGERASVYGVYKTPEGVDYDNVSVAATGVQGSAGQAAILFAGRKNDKTLLAVGKIYSVDDVRGSKIKSDSEYVTFELFALTGGVSYEPEFSSFLTAYNTSEPVSADNTYIMDAIIGGTGFPLFRLPQGKAAVDAEYTIELDGDVKWEDFAKGILVSEVFDEGTKLVCLGSVTLRNPRYNAGGGYYWYADYPMDITTKAVMVNNQKKGVPAENKIKIQFNTLESTEQRLGKDGIGMFTLGFRIPVVPLMPSDDIGFVSPTDEGEEASEGHIAWFIRPACQSYYYNIDNGVDSTGGGVLMGFFSTAYTKKYFDRTWS